MRDPSDITPLQAEILDLALTGEGVTAADVRAGLSVDRDLARTTVATMLGRMHGYGWLERVRDGREFIYTSAISRGQLRAAQLGRIVRSVFSNDLPSLVAHALHECDYDEQDLEHVQELISRYREARGGRE